MSETKKMQARVAPAGRDPSSSVADERASGEERAARVEALLARYHTALSEITALFVSDRGWLWGAVEQALSVLAEGMGEPYRFPTTLSLAQRIEEERRVHPHKPGLLPWDALAALAAAEATEEEGKGGEGDG